MLEVRRLSAGYPGAPVLSDLSLSLPEGRVTVIVGPNGCGKSTLLKSMAGILGCTGQILLDGEELTTLSPKARAQRIAYLPQDRQTPEITVRRLVLHGRFPYLHYPRQYRKEDHAAAEQAMAAMGISAFADRELASLSGGQRQKVYIAMLLAQDTKAVLLDEPTAYLDIAHQLQLMTLARTLADAGKTVVLVLHDLTLALEHADRVVVLSHGAVAAQGNPEAVFQSGCLRQTFNVDVGRTLFADKWKYFYDP